MNFEGNTNIKPITNGKSYQGADVDFMGIITSEVSEGKDMNTGF